MDCGTKMDWSTVPKQYRCGSRLVPWQDYFGTDTVLEFLLGSFLNRQLLPNATNLLSSLALAERNGREARHTTPFNAADPTLLTSWPNFNLVGILNATYTKVGQRVGSSPKKVKRPTKCFYLPIGKK